MIAIEYSEMEKIVLLDRLFGSIGYDDLRSLVESEQVVSKLKGTGTNSRILESLVQDNTAMSVDLMHTRNELNSLKGDFQTLLKVLNMTVFSYSQDLNNLKQKHNVY